MGTTGFKSLDTRPKRRWALRGAVLVLMLLAVSCTGGDGRGRGRRGAC